MKTLNGKKITKALALSSLAIFSVLNLTACPSSGGSSTTTAIPANGLFGNSGLAGGFGGVSGVPAGGTTVATALATMTYSGTPALQMGLQFYSYGGGLGAQGYLYTNVNWQSCGIPAGSYTVQASQPGQLSNGVIQGMILTASGNSGTFQIVLVQDFFTPKTQVGPDGTTFPDALQGRMQFAVNGQVCNDQLAY